MANNTDVIRSQKQLKRAIFSMKEKLEDTTIFLSDAYKHFLTTMRNGIAEGTSGKATMFRGGKDGAIAYTDGSDTYINYDNCLAEGLERTEKNTLFLGLNLHEIGHLLFTDFSLSKRIQEKLMYDKTIYPSLPSDTKYLDEVQEFIDKNGASVISPLFHNLNNCIEDGFVDRAVMSLIRGYAYTLRFARKRDASLDRRTFSQMQADKVDEEQIFINLILNYARHGERLYDNTEIAGSELLQEVRECEPLVKTAVFTTSPMQRAKATWIVFCRLFHFVKIQNDKKQQQNQQQNSQNQQNQQQQQSGQQQPENGQQSQGSEQGNSTEKITQSSPSSTPSLKEALEELGKNTPNTEKTERRNLQANENSQSLPTSSASKKLEEAMKSAGLGASTEKEETKHTPIDKLTEEIAEEEVAKQQEKNLLKEMQKGAKAEINGIHRTVNAEPQRISVTESGKRDYEICHRELDVIVRRFIKDFQKEITERQTGDTLTGLYAGKRITVRDLHRQDLKIFNRNILPEDIPDMAVGIMVDLSGSMGGDRINYAKKCAYITYSFCQKLGVPVFVVGHDASSGGDNTVHLKSIVDEYSLDGKDALRIFSMQSGWCNRDGYALRYCLQKLKAIPSEQKLMLVISDGQPNGYNYKLLEGRKDCQDAVSKAIKEGITTICAGIGSDTASVKSVYKEGISEKNSAHFLDITDLEKLPKAFIKIIKRALE